MATVPPPPSKRRRVEQLERTKAQQDVSPAATGLTGSFFVRFADEDGKQTVDTVEVPLAEATDKNLSLLYNTLLGRVSSGLSSCLWILP